MLKCLPKPVLLSCLIIGLFLINHPSSYGSSTEDGEGQPQTKVTLAEQSSQWIEDNPLLVASASVAAIAASYYYLTQPDSSCSVLDNFPRGCSFYIKPKHLFAIAENTTIHCGNFTSKIYGWVSSCYDPQRYSLGTLQDCLSSCLNPLVEMGISGAKCFDYVKCWAKNTTDILTCDNYTPGWTITNKTLFNESNIQGIERWTYGNISEWFNRSNWYLFDIGFEHPELIFHWQERNIHYINPDLTATAWECFTKALGF